MFPVDDHAPPRGSRDGDVIYDLLFIATQHGAQKASETVISGHRGRRSVPYLVTGLNIQLTGLSSAY